jgi:hypothetical protein
MTSRRSPRSQRHPVRKKKFSPLLSSAAIAFCIAAGFAWLEHSGPLSRFGFAARNHPLILSSTPLPRNLVAGDSEAIRNGNYQAIDEQARALEYRGDSLSELAGLLSRYAVTEAEKARVIYAWIAHHITYDVASYQSRNYGDVTPQGVLRSRSTVCAGYANLYQALAQEMGLEASVIEGYGRGNGYLVLGSSTLNHAWNAVRIDRAWYVLDVTWGAGTVSEDRFQPEFNPYYFATPPEQMIYSHFPAQSPWQLLPVPYENPIRRSAESVRQFFRQRSPVQEPFCENDSLTWHDRDYPPSSRRYGNSRPTSPECDPDRRALYLNPTEKRTGLY